MARLADRGHVYRFGGPFEPSKPPQVGLERVGLRNATVFTGLCAQHDAELFRPIEDCTLDPEQPGHLSLLAYRAVLHETHASMEAARRLQSSYLKACEVGLQDPEAPDEAALFVTYRVNSAYEMYLHKQRWDEAIASAESGSEVQHDLVRLQGTGPRVAAASVFSLDGVSVGGDVARVALNVLPHGPDTLALFSYLSEEAGSCRPELHEVLNSSGATQEYFVARLLLERCENVVLAPSVVDGMSEEQRITIVSFFNETILRNDTGFQSPLLNLFRAAA